MELALLVPEYIAWHYTKALRLTVNIISNFLWFVYHFFSVPILSKTLFEPLRGVGKGFADVSRIFGFIIRGASIFFAYAIMTLLALVGLVVVIVWLFLPFIVIGLVIDGFTLLFP